MKKINNIYMHFLIGLAKKMVAYGLLLWVLLTYYNLGGKK